MEYIEHSRKNMASYGCAKALIEFFTMAFTTYAFFFYEAEIGLNVLLVGLGFIIFALWNAINDPIVGYLTNRPFKFTKKWGRRFPWIMGGGVLWIFSYLLLFTPPKVDPKSGAWILFAWLVFSSCLYDTFASIFFVNTTSLFPDKFRSVEERRETNMIATPVGILGIFLGGIIPPLLIEYEQIHSYIIQAGVMILLGMILLILSIPGCKEDQLTIDRYLTTYDTNNEEESFFSALRSALKQKSFIFFILAYLFYQTCTLLMQASISYAVRYILKMQASATILILVGLLLGAVMAIPLWIKLASKTNDNRKVMMIAGFSMTIATTPLIILNDYYLLVIALFIWGLAFGGYWVMLAPVLADVIDESVVRTSKREEGIYNGFLQFFGRLSFLFAVLSIVIVHYFTGFVEGAGPEAQSPLAIMGIQIHLGLIPMIFILASTIILWKFYDLTPEKVKLNQEKIKEMGL